MDDSVVFIHFILRMKVLKLFLGIKD